MTNKFYHHYKTPIICGISEPRYSDKELAELKARDERTFNIDGHEMTGYEASQAMRRLETAVREQKGIKAMAQASGDKLAVRECNERIKRYQGKYKEISDIAGIAQDKKRMTLTKGADSGIIKTAGYTKPKINTDEVYQQAKNGIRHKGVYDGSQKKNENRLYKSMISHEKQVQEHLEKLNNPEKYDVEWNIKNEVQKQGLLKKWQKDMIRNAEQAEIERTILNERFGRK